MDGDLNVFANTVHEVFCADENLAIENVDASNMVGCNGVAFKGLFVGHNQFAGFVVLVQRLAAADIVVVAITGNALAPFDFKGVDQGVFINGLLTRDLWISLN